MTEDQLALLTREMIESYDNDSTVADHGCSLPSRESIIHLIEEVRRVLFPGFYAPSERLDGGRMYQVGHWLASLDAELTRILVLALHQNPHRDQHKNDCEVTTTATELSRKILGHLPHLRRQLFRDAHAAIEGDPAAGSIEEVILTYPGFEAICTHRFAHLLYQAKVPYLPRALSEYAHTQTGIDLHPGAQIGDSFFIDHGTGVVIGETTVIGARVKIYQGVTLGALSVKRTLAGVKRHPTIEDDVVIYAGTTVLGGETVIGAGATLGGNLWIVDSVAPGSRVIGRPPSFELREPKLTS